MITLPLCYPPHPLSHRRPYRRYRQVQKIPSTSSQHVGQGTLYEGPVAAPLSERLQANIAVPLCLMCPDKNQSIETVAGIREDTHFAKAASISAFVGVWTDPPRAYKFLSTFRVTGVGVPSMVSNLDAALDGLTVSAASSDSSSPSFDRESLSI
jgi:hypothetical protein